MNKVRQAYNDLEIWRAKRLAMKSRGLHMAPPMVCEWDYQVVDSSTGKIKDTGRQLTHSFTRNYLNFMALSGFFYSHDQALIGSIYGEGSLRLKNISNVLFPSETMNTVTHYLARSSSAGIVAGSGGTPASVSSIFAVNGGTAHGTLFGTNNTAESLDDYTLGDMLPHSAGVQEYSAMVRGIPAFNGVTKIWTVDWTRSFSNYSGINIIIAEVGIYAYLSASTTPQQTCVIRDVLASPITLANGERLNFTYRFSYAIS